jgi:hypothetical protein
MPEGEFTIPARNQCLPFVKVLQMLWRQLTVLRECLPEVRPAAGGVTYPHYLLESM